MPATPFDSAIYRELFGDPELARLFSDTAEIRAMLLVEGALAKAQGAAGLIPETAAAAIHRAALEVQIDPAALAPGAGRSAVPVPALVAAFRGEIGAPEHGHWLHHGATSQDIVDTAQALRLRQALAVTGARLDGALAALGRLAAAHAETPMAGRTYGQVAVPTSFGAVVAAWGRPLVALRDDLPEVRDAVAVASLSGAAGTLSELGDAGPQVRAALAAALGLRDPGAGWHSERDGLQRLAGWCTRLCGCLGKMGEDLLLLTRSEIGEVRLGRSGGSSTMPQKANPVAPSVLAALARLAPGLQATLALSAAHREQRDGAAWMAEWLALPQLVLAAGKAAAVAAEMVPGLVPQPERMRATLGAGGGAAFAERLSFALAARMPRPEAQAAAGELAAAAHAGGPDLASRARARWPDLPADLFDPAAALGQAPAEARAFAAAARASG